MRKFHLKIDATEGPLWNGFNKGGKSWGNMTDWSSKTVEQLKIELRSRGLGVSGNKSVLVEKCFLESEKRRRIQWSRFLWPIFKNVSKTVPNICKQRFIFGRTFNGVIRLYSKHE